MKKLMISQLSFACAVVSVSQLIMAEEMMTSEFPTVDVYTISSEPMKPASVTACIGLSADVQRLACYDALFRLNDVEKQQQLQEKQAEKEFVVLASQQLLPENATLSEKIAHSIKYNPLFKEGDDFSPNDSYFDRHWELTENSKLQTWNLRSYKPIYALPVVMTSHKNTLPKSENANNSATTAGSLKSVESKFQLSLKTKALENIFGNNGDVWIGYTQSSRWQVYNGRHSSPFRETNYEPEAMLIFRTNYEVLGLNARLLGVGINHQSNGLSDPYSRSWNRLMFNVGVEKGNFAMMIRPWIRIPEKAEDDNNPKISDYVGRADATLYYQHNQQNVSLMLRHSLRGSSDSKGAAQLDWTFPIKGKLRGHVQAFHGYGESLIDYNHRATYLGLGVSLEDAF